MEIKKSSWGSKYRNKGKTAQLRLKYKSKVKKHQKENELHVSSYVTTTSGVSPVSGLFGTTGYSGATSYVGKSGVSGLSGTTGYASNAVLHGTSAQSSAEFYKNRPKTIYDVDVEYDPRTCMWVFIP